MREAFERFRVAFWMFSGGLLALYIYGLLWRAYSPLELGLISVVCVTLLVLFAFHEVRLRLELHRHPREVDHADKERRGF